MRGDRPFESKPKFVAASYFGPSMSYISVSAFQYHSCEFPCPGWTPDISPVIAAR